MIRCRRGSVKSPNRYEPVANVDISIGTSVITSTGEWEGDILDMEENGLCLQHGFVN